MQFMQAVGKNEVLLNCKYRKNGSLWVCEVLLLEYFAELRVCEFARSCKICGKLEKSQNLLKLENSRAPAKSAIFAIFAKLEKKLEKLQNLLTKKWGKIIRLLIFGNFRKFCKSTTGFRLE